MRVIIFVIVLWGVVAGCGTPHQFHDYRDYERSNYTEEPKFSSDPLLQSVYYDRYLRCLERCADSKKCK
jgi:hypothetical protein